mmetsp:Transcript_71274/g.208938  ORF Transcript_71274/g.208938 Transcript_71274/m.208938 type:complete len:202 (+) Transcript_71274:999-1604(+)
MKPQKPAPPSPWATLDLEDVMTRGSDLGVALITFLKEPTSMGSPSEVPVPWHSKQSTSVGVRWHSLSTAFRHFSWAGPLGAVKLALRPSWFAWLPARHAKTCPSFWYCLILKQAAPQSSPRAYPSAVALNVKDRPSWLSMPAAQQPTNGPWNSIRFKPLTMEPGMGSKSLKRKCSLETCVQTRDEEHAVSMVILAPFKFRE